MAPSEEVDTGDQDDVSGVFSDETVFNDWIQKTQMAVVRFCRQFVDDWSEAEDVAQEAYIRAWQKRNSFKGKSSLLTWQMAIARRVCLDYLRSRKRLTLLPLDESTAAPEHSIDTQIDVQKALYKLNANDRIILYLRVGEDMSFDETAQVLGKKAAACRKQYERAKERFEAVYNGRKDN